MGGGRGCCVWPLRWRWAPARSGPWWRWTRGMTAALSRPRTPKLTRAVRPSRAALTGRGRSRRRRRRCPPGVGRSSGTTGSRGRGDRRGDRLRLVGGPGRLLLRRQRLLRRPRRHEALGLPDPALDGGRRLSGGSDDGPRAVAGPRGHRHRAQRRLDGGRRAHLSPRRRRVADGPRRRLAAGGRRRGHAVDLRRHRRARRRRRRLVRGPEVPAPAHAGALVGGGRDSRSARAAPAHRHAAVVRSSLDGARQPVGVGKDRRDRAARWIPRSSPASPTGR